MPAAIKQQKEVTGIRQSIQSVLADLDTGIFCGIWRISHMDIGIGATLIMSLCCVIWSSACPFTRSPQLALRECAYCGCHCQV